MSAAELLVILDRENAIVRKLTARDLRAGTGPSQEMKAARAQACLLYTSDAADE